METQTIEPVQATRAADPATVAAHAGAAAFVIAAGWFWLATIQALTTPGQPPAEAAVSASPLAPPYPYWWPS